MLQGTEHGLLHPLTEEFEIFPALLQDITNREFEKFLGQALAEWAVVLPAVLLLTLGIIQFSLVLIGKIVVNHAAYAATRARLVSSKEGPYQTDSAMAKIKKTIADGGVYAFIRPNMICVAPPLCITEEQLMEGLRVVDKPLDVADAMVDSSRLAAE